MTGQSVEIGFALFVLCTLLAALAIVALVLRYQRRKIPVRSLGPSTLESVKPGAKRQVAAVPVRFGTQGKVEVLVISTRGSGRWTVPKGWPMPGRSDAEAAALEAYEEAGVRGTIATEPIGAFEYVKRRNELETLFVTVYRLDVTHEVRRWRERGQRRQRWLSAPAAADCVAWVGLAAIIRSLEATPADATIV